VPKKPSALATHAVAAVTLLLCVALVGCYVPSAARRSARLLKHGWDRGAFGNYVVLTGPGMSVLAVGDFAAHAFVPFQYDGYFLVDRREPQQKWFRFYTGPVQQIDRVAILCNRERATTVTTIRTEEQERATFARHQKWHYPQCIEALPGTYELKIDFYSRETFQKDYAVATYSTESTSPATITWEAEAGSIYLLSAVLGDVTPAPGVAYSGTTLKRLTRTSTNLGSSEFTLDEGHWLAILEKVDSFDEIDSPVLEHREAWRRYELRRRDH
jgi:hypothetical protein